MSNKYQPSKSYSILRDAIEARRDYDAVADMLAQEADMRAAQVAKLGAGHD